MIASLSRIARRFRTDNRANTAIIVALCAVPLFAMLGFAIDYGTALSDKSKLDQAADAAAMVAITTAKNIANAQGGSFTSPINVQTAGQAAGLKAFAANAGKIAFASVPTPVVTVTPTQGQQTITAQVTYSSTGMKTNFSKMLGIKTIPLNGTSTASLKIGTYIDFYLLLDVSGSMGLPTSAAGQTQLAAINPDMLSSYPGGCMFACHFSGYQGFALTRDYNIPLRADSVESAVCSMITQAISSETLTNQFRIGIYPFIQYIEEYYPISTNLTGAINAVTGGTSGTCPSTLTSTGLVGLLDQGLDATVTNPLGSGGTHFENAITAQGSSFGIGQYIQTIGSGDTSASPAPFIFLVTDGMDNSQTYTQEWGFQGGSNPLAMTSTATQAACASLKAQGVTISILYIPYVDIPANPSPYTASWAIAEDSQADNQIPSLPGALQSCANTGYFYQATSQAEITAAINAMFNQAIQVARITN